MFYSQPYIPTGADPPWRVLGDRTPLSKTSINLSSSRATKLKKDQLSSSIIKRNRFFWLKADKLGLLEGLFGHSSVFHGTSFKIFNKKSPLFYYKSFGLSDLDCRTFKTFCYPVSSVLI